MVIRYLGLAERWRVIIITEGVEPKKTSPFCNGTRRRIRHCLAMRSPMGTELTTAHSRAGSLDRREFKPLPGDIASAVLRCHRKTAVTPRQFAMKKPSRFSTTSPPPTRPTLYQPVRRINWATNLKSAFPIDNNEVERGMVGRKIISSSDLKTLTGVQPCTPSLKAGPRPARFLGLHAGQSPSDLTPRAMRGKILAPTADRPGIVEG